MTKSTETTTSQVLYAHLGRLGIDILEIAGLVETAGGVLTTEAGMTLRLVGSRLLADRIELAQGIVWHDADEGRLEIDGSSDLRPGPSWIGCQLDDMIGDDRLQDLVAEHVEENLGEWTIQVSGEQVTIYDVRITGATDRVPSDHRDHELMDSQVDQDWRNDLPF